MRRPLGSCSRTGHRRGRQHGTLSLPSAPLPGRDITYNGPSCATPMSEHDLVGLARRGGWVEVQRINVWRNRSTTPKSATQCIGKGPGSQRRRFVATLDRFIVDFEAATVGPRHQDRVA